MVRPHVEAEQASDTPGELDVFFDDVDERYISAPLRERDRVVRKTAPDVEDASAADRVAVEQPVPAPLPEGSVQIALSAPKVEQYVVAEFEQPGALFAPIGERDGPPLAP